jgi:PAS domain S-box-containing protein
MTDQPIPSGEGFASFDRGADARKLVDSVVDYALYLLDLDGVVRSWNPGAQRIKGYRPEEIIGCDFSVFYTEDDIRAGEPARALRMARTDGRFEAEGWRVRKDGSRFWAAIVIDAVSDSAGAITGFAKVTRDATRHLAERIAFDEEAAKCRIIFEAAPNGMLIVDETGTITLANARVETIFGYPPGGLLGRSVDVLVPDALRAGHAAKRESFADESVPRAMADHAQSRNDNERTVCRGIGHRHYRAQAGRSAACDHRSGTKRSESVDGDGRADGQSRVLAFRFAQARDALV